MAITKLANNVIINSTTVPAISPAVSMAGSNAINVQVTVLSGGGGSSNIAITVQGSDDMENWLTTGLTGSSISLTAMQVGSVGAGQCTAFGYAYARLQYLLAGASPLTTVAAVDVNTYQN